MRQCRPTSSVSIIGAVFVVFLVGTFSFFAIRVLPGDFATASLGLDAGSASADNIAQRRADLGLDKPIGEAVRESWLWDTVRLDLRQFVSNPEHGLVRDRPLASLLD